jgi:hypothetical protein
LDAVRFVPSFFIRLLSVFYIALHFAWFAFDGTRVGWTEDDPMNMYMYWKPGLAKVLAGNVEFWNGFYRPLGGLFYLPVYAVAGMNPAPYRSIVFALLALNAFLVYTLATRLGGSVRLAGLACLFVCVHGWMADLVYNTSSIYDVLCFTFSLSTLIVYAGGRASAESAGVLRGAGTLALMLLAINAKEIAATLPAFLLLYEILFHPPEKDGLPSWLRRNAAWSFIALAIAAFAMYGKMHGADSMTLNEQYRPVFSFARWIDANAAYTGTIFYRHDITAPVAAGIWIAMAALAWISKSRILAFATVFILLVTIPISFIPKRLGGSLYLPLAGWAIWFAAFFDWLISYLPARWFPRSIATLAIAITFSRWTAHGFAGRGEVWRETQKTPNQVLAMLERFDYRPPHDKHVLFIGSPYKDVYDLVFLANLVWNDRTLEIEDANLTPDHGSDRSRFDVVIGFENGRLELLKK